MIKFIAPGITIGRSLMVGTDMNSKFGVNTWVHESYHFYQQLRQSIAGQLMKGLKEQWILRTIKGIDPYNSPGTNENSAYMYAEKYFPLHYY